MAKVCQMNIKTYLIVMSDKEVILPKVNSAKWLSMNNLKNEERLAEPNDTFQKYRNVFGRIADKMPVSNGPRIIIASNPDPNSWKEKLFSYNKKSDHGK